MMLPPVLKGWPFTIGGFYNAHLLMAIKSILTLFLLVMLFKALVVYTLC